jgi:hypothetical protein
MPKNKTAINIARELDLGSVPRTDSWHFSRYAQQSANPATGYATGGRIMGFAHALSHLVYTQINVLLGVPYRLGQYTDTLDNSFRQFIQTAPGGPSKYHMMLAGIPLATAEIEVLDPPPPGDPPSPGGQPVPAPNITNVRSIPNAEFQCFAHGYQQLPLYRMHQARFISHLYAYYFGERPDEPTGQSYNPSEMARSVSVSLEQMIIAVREIEAFFRCICRSYQSCGKPRPEPRGNWHCALGDTVEAQSNALGPPDGAPVRFHQLLLNTLPNEGGDCAERLERIINNLQNPGRNRNPANIDHLFEAVDKIYAQTVVNTSDWNAPNELGLRVNSINAFMIVILAMCDVAIKFRELLVTLTSAINSLSTEITSTSPSGEQCTLQQAAHVYAKFFVRVWGRFPITNRERAMGLPQYIINELNIASTGELVRCAQNISACRVNPAPLWLQLLNFSDIGMPARFTTT